ncbi:MAG: amidohydrolase family protein, partial [Tepidisphaeraceae bacterium]
ELYQAAEEHSLFISFHTGIHRSRLGQSRVINFDEIAWNFPRLKFSLEHVGGYHFFNEALAVLAVHLPAPWETGTSNVFAGLTSVFTTPFNKFWHMSDEQLRELAGQVGARQLIFGLDFPYNLEEHTRTGLRRVRELFGEQDQSLILGGNLRRELGVP